MVFGRPSRNCPEDGRNFFMGSVTTPGAPPANDYGDAPR
jgi:hypothetical protein